MKKRMKQYLTGLCFALLMAGSGVILMPAQVQAEEVPTYEQVCCGSLCGGGDSCDGYGEYFCCKP